MIEFFRRAPGRPRRLGILPGAFNPPTRAHVALAEAALGEVDEVLFVLPRAFPHKAYQGASFAERIEMLQCVATPESRLSIASTDRGLFIDIARECRSVYGDMPLAFICGSDAAERIVNWDYGHPGAFPPMLEMFELLVATRGRDYQPPKVLAHRIHALALAPRELSATEVRRRIARGEPWQHLVPPSIVPLARRIYGALPAS